MRKFFNTIIVLSLLFILTGCNNKEITKEKEVKNETNQTETKNEKRTAANTDYEKCSEKQMAMPTEGEQVAIIHVKKYGDMKVRFFPEIAPKAVENFVTHSKNGYYNGLTFHRVINEFMIQGGDPEGTGRGGESVWGEGFGPELDLDLVPYRGSLCMAMSSMPNSIGSQFFITQAHADESVAATLRQANYPESLVKEYEKYGGYLSLYMNYTVFGQVYEGLDVLDKIASVETYDGLNNTQEDKPIEDVIIESIEVTTYSAK